MTRILAIDDEPPILRAVTTALTAQGYDVDVAATARQAIAKATSAPHDLLIVDLGLPDMSGFEVIRQVRVVEPTVPILVLSAMQDSESKVEALDLGADDYLSKPFSMPELLARIRVALRHTHQRTGRPEDPELLVRGSLTIDTATRTVTLRGTPVQLPRIQFKLLHFFAQHPNRVLTYRALSNNVWGLTTDADPQTIRVTISQLRKRIETNPAQPTLIRTDLGIGYRFTPDDVNTV